jgi:hypothetical protein
MSKPKVPKAPNYTNLANQQAGLENQAAEKTTLQNRPNQVTGEGSTTWTVGPDGRPVQTTALNPTLAGAQTAQQGTQRELWQGAQGLAPSVVDTLSHPWDTSGAPALGDPSYAATQQIIDATMGQMRPELDRQRQQQEAQLIAQGLRGGEQSYGRMQYDLGDNELNARQKAVLAGTTEAGNVFNRQNIANQLWRANSLQNRELPAQELTGLMGLGGNIGAGINAPGFASATPQSAPNLLGAAGQQYSADMARANAKNQGGFWNGLLKLGGTAVGALAGNPAIGSMVGNGVAGLFGGGGGDTSMVPSGGYSTQPSNWWN